MTNFIKPPFPDNEDARLQALYSYDILDTPAEPAFDDLAKLAAAICQTPIALVSLIDENRQWFKARVGLEVAETSRELAFCAHAIVEPESVFVVPNALEDPRFAENSLVTADPDIRFYAGAPLLTPENQPLGTLCVIDRVPRYLSAEQLAALQILSHQVTTQIILRRNLAQTKELNTVLQRLSLVARKTQNAVIITDAAGYIEWVNEGFYRITGYAPEEVTGKKPGHLLQGSKTDLQTVEKMREAIATLVKFDGEIFNYRKNGEGYWISLSVTPIFDETHQHQGFIAIVMDISARKHSEEVLFQKEQQLLQAHKMEAVGQLAAGIAHEINTPTQYVGDNVRFLDESFESIIQLLQEQDQLIKAYQTNSATDELKIHVDSTAAAVDVEFLMEEAPRAIQQSLQGIEHISKIVSSMKEFAHPGSAEKKDTDIHRAIESTIMVASNEWKYVAEIERDFDENLQSVPVILREFNQVILNLLVNAAHAISDVVKADGQNNNKGIIKISTRRDGDWAEIRLADSGGGIPVHARAKIFDPFFTTKEVGRGTGQGLAISHSVIVDKHQGTINFETEEGRGTTFIIRLPL